MRWWMRVGESAAANSGSPIPVRLLAYLALTFSQDSTGPTAVAIFS